MDNEGIRIKWLCIAVIVAMSYIFFTVDNYASRAHEIKIMEVSK